MVQHLLDKMAGIIRSKKAERNSLAAGGDAGELDRLGQSSRSGEAGVAGRAADGNGARGFGARVPDPGAFEETPVLSGFHQGNDDEARLNGAVEWLDSAKAKFPLQSDFQQVPQMTRDISHNHSNHSSQAAALMPADLLETVGRENEGLRHRCEEVVRKVEEAATLRQDLAAVFGHVDVILKDLERTKAALAQRTAALAAERDNSHDMKARHRQLLSDHDQLRDENVSLHSERQKHQDFAGETETQLQGLMEALADKSKHFTDLSRRSDADRERLAQMEIDVRAAREEMQRADDLIFSLQSDLSAARDHATLVEEDNKTLQANLSDARQQIARLARRENEAQAILTANKQRIDDLELMVNSERSEHGKTRGLYQGESASRRAEVSSLQTRLDAMTTRAEANDRLLGETRTQMHTKIEELRKAERRIQELLTASGPLDTRVASLEQENKALHQKVSELVAVQLSLSDHSETLAKSVRAKDKDAAGLKQRVEALTDRFHIEMNRYEEERERMQQTIARLGEHLEKEKLDRAMAEGALEVARKHRLAQTSAGRMREPAAAPLAGFETGSGLPGASDMRGGGAAAPGDAEPSSADVVPIRKSA